MPVVDICTIELPLNHTHGQGQSTDHKVLCKTLYSDRNTKKLFGDLKLSGMSTVSEMMTAAGRHIRHHRQHEKKEQDIRNRMNNHKMVLPNNQLHTINEHLGQTSNRNR